VQGRPKRADLPYLLSGPLGSSAFPLQMRWSPLPDLDSPHDFIGGLRTICANGDVRLQAGMALHTYFANQNMENRYFVCNDGELLVVPHSGSLRFHTEFGLVDLEVGEFLLIPRGIKFRVLVGEEPCRGFVCENYGSPFRLPELGAIGSYGLANAKDFLAPTAAFEDREGPFNLVQKYGGSIWSSDLRYSPLDVVAWRGTNVPVKFDMALFVSIGSVSEDHLDPSIFTALTSAADPVLGANCDLLILAPQWVVGETTFRSPPFHRNTASEFSVMIRGGNPIKMSGSTPGGMVLHNSCAPHGPDRGSFERTTARDDPKPYKQQTAWMVAWESRFPFVVTDYALQTPALQGDYPELWSDIESNFTG
jgi:homogentisate 1,2-dioxygenase